MSKVDNPTAFRSLVKRSLQYLASSIMEEVCLGKFGQLLLRNQGNHQILLRVFPSCYTLLHICVLKRLESQNHNAKHQSVVHKTMSLLMDLSKNLNLSRILTWNKTHWLLGVWQCFMLILTYLLSWSKSTNFGCNIFPIWFMQINIDMCTFVKKNV